MKTRYKDLGNYLKNLRLKANLSQLEVAHKLGYSSPQFVSNWERGLSSPPMICLKKLAKCYNEDVEEMFQVTFRQVEKEMRRAVR